MAHSKTFYLKDGKSFSTLKSLAKELKGMSQDIYTHHVNPHKNDFSNWVRNSLAKEDLAKKVDGHISKIELELEVLRHLIFEESNKALKSAKKSAKKSMPKMMKEEKSADAVVAKKPSVTKKAKSVKKQSTPKVKTTAPKKAVTPKKVVKKTSKKASTTSQ